MAGGTLIKGTLLVALGLVFVQEAYALGSCRNRNSLPNYCDCEIYTNTEETSEGATLMTYSVSTQAVTSEEFRPRVTGRRFYRKNSLYLYQCTSLCFDHLRAKLQQENTDGDSKAPPTSNFLTDNGKDALCDLMFNDPTSTATMATAGANAGPWYFFLTVSRPDCNDGLDKTLYIGNTNCKCYYFPALGNQKCYRDGGPDPSAASGTYALL